MGHGHQDYSANGDAWQWLSVRPGALARIDGTDGLAGISDREQRICFAVALWNGRDPILKERLFGLSGIEGNHGEDVKEMLLLRRRHADPLYIKWLYEVPAGRIPLFAAAEENARRGRDA